MASHSAKAEMDIGLVTRAIQQRICFEAFWWGNHSFKFGTTVPVSVRRDGDRAYVWSEELAIFFHSSRWANFFSISTRDGQTIVDDSIGYNLDIMQGTPDFEQKKGMIFHGKVEAIRLRVPKDCEPHFGKTTPLKERITNAIVTSVGHQLALFNNFGGHYPQRLRIVIAKFNIDYPETLVFLPAKDELLHVVLQDERDLLVMPEYNKRQEELVARVVKYGIVREVNLRAR